MRTLREFLLSLAGRLALLKLVSRAVNFLQVKTRPDGAPSFPFIKRRRLNNFQILVYHRVNDENDPFFPAISTTQFARHMEILSGGFTVCSLDRLIEGIETADVPENAIAITFDDGYVDNYLNAFPILKQHSLPATIFLATGVIGSGGRLWHDDVFSAFRKTEVPFLTGFESELGKVPLRTLAEKLKAQIRVLELFWRMDDQQRNLSIARLNDCLSVCETRQVEGLMMSWQHAREMSLQGIDFGGHTVTHPILSRLPPESAAREIIDSIRAIQDNLGTRVTSFAYPVGRKMDFDSTTKNLLRNAGVHCGLTMILGNNEVGTDPYELRRIAPWGESPEAFALRLNYYKFLS